MSVQLDTRCRHIIDTVPPLKIGGDNPVDDEARSGGVTIRGNGFSQGKSLLSPGVSDRSTRELPDSVLHCT